MTTEQLDTLMDRIRKLHAKAESARQIGSLAEAEAFADAVSRLLMKHKLDASILEQAGQIAEEIEAGELDWQEFGVYGKRVGWIELLSLAVSRAYFCRMYLISGGGTRIILVGKPSDREVAGYMIRFLTATAHRLAEEANKAEKKRMKKLTGSFAVAGFRKAFLAGFVSGISSRLREAREQAVSQNSGMAVVLSTADAQLDAFMRGQKLRNTKALTRPRPNAEAYNQGKDAASKINLNSPVGGSTWSAPKALTGGN